MPSRPSDLTALSKMVVFSVPRKPLGESSGLMLFQDVISDCLKHKRMSGAPAEIKFKEGVTINPLHINIARPLPIHMKKEADLTLNKYIKEGIIEPVNYPTTWLSPAFWVAKGDKKSVRLVTDYKEINKYIECNVHPFASAADCIKQIPDGTKYFCSADCLSGYYQVPLSSSASDLTTFFEPVPSLLDPHLHTTCHRRAF